MAPLEKMVKAVKTVSDNLKHHLSIISVDTNGAAASDNALYSGKTMRT